MKIVVPEVPLPKGAPAIDSEAVRSYLCRPMAAETSERFILLQALRALSAFGVAAFHLKSFFALKFGLHGVLPGFLSVGIAGVHVFFVISGFVIVYSSSSLINRQDRFIIFYLRRCVRIIPMYWALSLIVLVNALFFHDPIRIARVLTSFTFIPMANSKGLILPLLVVGWTLNFEMFFYAVFAIGLFTLRQSVVIGVSGFFVMLVILPAVAGPFQQPIAFWAQPIILEFVFGMILAVAYRKGVRFSSTFSASLIAVALIGFGMSTHPFHAFPRGILWGCLAIIVVAGAVLGPKPKIGPQAFKFLNLLGNASYSLYLTHRFSFNLPILILPSLLAPKTHVLSYAFLIMLNAVVVAVFIHLLVERPMTIAITRFFAPVFRVVS